MNLVNVILVGVEAAKPAAGIAGRLYFASDTLKVFRDDGADWIDVTPAAPSIISMGFLIGWNGGVADGSDIAGHRYILSNCAPVALRVGAVTPPSGGDQSITIFRVRAGVSESILNAPVVLTDGSYTVASTDFVEGMALQDGDYLTVSSSISAGTPAADVFVGLQVQGS